MDFSRFPLPCEHSTSRVTSTVTCERGASNSQLPTRLSASRYRPPSSRRRAFRSPCCSSALTTCSARTATSCRSTATTRTATHEVGVDVDSTGSIVLRSWITDDPIDIDVRWEAAVALGILTSGLITLGIEGLTAYIQSEVNDKIVNGFRDIVENAILSAPKIMAMLLRADFTL